MVTLSEYLGLVFKEISNARAMADAEAQRVAKMYQSDEMLQHFSVPRFKIPEISLNIPLAISNVEVEAVYEFQLKEDQVKEFFHKKFDIRNDINSYPEIRQFLKKIRKNPSADFKKNLDYKKKIIANEFNNVMKSVLVRNNIKLKFNNNPNYEKNFGENTKNEFLKLIESSFTVKQKNLKNLMIRPETDIVREQSTEHSVFSVNVKLIEEGFTLNTLEDEKGNKVKVVHFE